MNPSAPAGGAIRLGHLSDLHAAAPLAWRRFNPKRLFGRLNWIFRRGREHDEARLGRHVEALCAARPDAVVVSGDLTQLGTPEEVARAGVLLAPLATAGIPVYLVRGNHDVYGTDAAGDFAALSARLRGDAPLAPPGVAEAGPVDLLLLDQAVPAPLFRDGGRMTRAALAALDAWLARRDRDRPLVAAGHYPLRGPHGLPLRPGRALGRAEALEARLAEAGVALYLCGHIHAPYRLDPPACPVPLRCAGSSTAKGTVALYRVGPDVLEEERLPAEVEAEAAETSGPSGFTPRSS